MAEEFSLTGEAESLLRDAIQGGAEQVNESQESTTERIEETIEEAGNQSPAEISFLGGLENQLQETLSGLSSRYTEALEGTFSKVRSQLEELQDFNISEEGFQEITGQFEELRAKLAQIQLEVESGVTSISEAEEKLGDATGKLQDNIESVFREENFENAEEVADIFSESAEQLSAAAQEGIGGVGAAQQVSPQEFGAGLQEGLGNVGGVAGLQEAAEGATLLKSKLGAASTAAAVLGVALGAAIAPAIDLFEDARDAQEEFRQQTGAGVERQRELRQVTQQVSSNLAEYGVGPQAVTDVTGQLIDDFGSVQTATSVIDEDLATITEQTGAISEAFGVSSDRAAEIRTQTEQLENQIGGSAEGTIAFTQELARANDVAPQQAIRQITENADQLAKFSGQLGPNLGEAAVQAQRLGTSLGSVTQFQEQTLTNITGQIQEIQKANQLVGNQLNAQRLLQASYKGTEATLKEVRSQLEGIDFENLDFFQRQRLAEALPGFSQQELANIAKAQEELEGISGETGKIASKISEGDLTLQQALQGENVDAFAQLQQDLNALYFTFAQQLSPAIEELATSIIPLLQAAIPVITPIFKGLATGISLVSNTLAGFLNLLTGRWETAAKSFKSVWESIIGLFGMGGEKAEQAKQKTAGFSSVFSSIVSTAAAAGGALLTVWTTLTGLSAALSSVGVWIASLGSGMSTFSTIAFTVGGAIAKIGGALGTLAATINPVTAAIVGIGAVIGGTVAIFYDWEEVTNALYSALSGLKSFFTADFWSTIGSTISTGFNEAIDYVQNNWQDLLIDAVMTAVGGIPGLIASYFVPEWSKIKPKLTSVLSNIESYLFSSPAEKGPLAEVDMSAGITESMSPEKVEKKTEQTVNAAAESAQQVEAQPAQEDVATVEQQTPTQQDQQQQAAETDTTGIEELLADLLEAQKNLNRALAQGDVGVELDGRKVNKEMTRDVRNL